MKLAVAAAGVVWASFAVDELVLDAASTGGECGAGVGSASDTGDFGAKSGAFCKTGGGFLMTGLGGVLGGGSGFFSGGGGGAGLGASATGLGADIAIIDTCITSGRAGVSVSIDCVSQYHSPPCNIMTSAADSNICRRERSS